MEETSFLATRQGKLTLLFLCGVGMLDFIDASIVNVALPSIRAHLHFSVQNLQWVLSAYLLTYGGFMLLGGRTADLIGRRLLLMSGTALFGASSLVGGFAQSEGMLIGARLVQGVGAAMMVPAALSALTTKFPEGRDRAVALGAWGGVAGVSSALGVFLGGVLSEGPGWRWVFFVNIPICLAILAAAPRLLPSDHVTMRGARFDALGAFLVTAAAMLLIYAVVNAPTESWGSNRTVLELVGAGVLLALFIVNESRVPDPLFPFSILRINGLAAADLTQLAAVAGSFSMFFFVTLYMQNVLGYSQITAGAAYVPTALGVAVGAGISTPLIPRIGTRPIIVVGAVVDALGLGLISRIPDHGSYAADLLPGLLVMAFGFGAIFVSVTTAAQAGVPHDKAGLAAALVNSSTWLGGALGVSIFTSIATSRTNHLLHQGASTSHALTGGFRWALVACAVSVVVAAVIAVRATNTRGEADESPGIAPPELAPQLS